MSTQVFVARLRAELRNRRTSRRLHVVPSSCGGFTPPATSSARSGSVVGGSRKLSHGAGPNPNRPSFAALWFGLALGLVLTAACAAREPVASPVAPAESTGGAASSAVTPSVGSPAGADGAAAEPAPVNLRLITFNDFHGNLEALDDQGRRLGGAEVMAAYIRSAQAGYDGRALIVHAGDIVGASPPVSGLLQDEPAIAFLNLLANAQCQLPVRDDPACNVVGTLGNHEFDEGVPEALRLIRGGNSVKGPFLADPYPGAKFPYVSANVVDRVSQQPLLPPYVVRTLGGISVGVIGAVLRGAPRLLNSARPGLDTLDFQDEVTAINRAASELVGRGVRVIVVTIHEGLEQPYYAGPTQRGALPGGDLQPILLGLHDEIDVVVAGHTHAFTNTFAQNANGHELLVVQSMSASRGVASVDIAVHPQTNQVLHATAAVYKTYGDVTPGNQPQPDVAELVHAAAARVATQTGRVVGTTLDDFPRVANEAGEIALGSVIADAQRAAGKAEIAITNPGGIRAGLTKGQVTWGQLFTAQPFGNQLVLVELSGVHILELLQRQWQGTEPRIFQISGFSYEWDAAAPLAQRVVKLRGPDGKPLHMTRKYRVVINDYLAAGGDGSGLSGIKQTDLGQTDVEALEKYFTAHPHGVAAPATPRISRVH